MPPRLQVLCRAARAAAQPPYQPSAPFLYPFLRQQQRSVSILSDLSDNKSAYNKRIRRGRGPASGKGKTAGRGQNGQKKHGTIPYGFTGGQTKDEVVAGSGGFDNVFSVDMSPINLNRIQAWIDKGRLDPTQPITLKELNESRCLHGVKDGVKLLARGKEELRSPVNIIVSRASAEAIQAVEEQGGTVTTRYYTKYAIKKILRGEMDPIHSLQSRIQLGSAGNEAPEAVADAIEQDAKRYKFRLPDPISRKNLEYYRDPAHRGYLSHLVPEGQGPSLFFKAPGTVKVKKGPQKGRKSLTHADNKLW